MKQMKPKLLIDEVIENGRNVLFAIVHCRGILLKTLGCCTSM
jgi:hypothetical protein